jgi:Dyp-type peroxidase family
MAVAAEPLNARPEAVRLLQAGFERPRFVNAGLVAQQEADGRADAGLPSRQFGNWLKVVSAADASGARDAVAALAHSLGLTLTLTEKFASAGGAGARLSLEGLLPNGALDPVRFRQMLGLYGSALADPALYADVLTSLGPDAMAAGTAALERGLLGVVQYELFRHGAPAFLKPAGAPSSPGMIRSEAEHAAVHSAVFDTAPCNIAFTYAGLEALNLDKATLASFPEPFKQGMAARAERLRDLGPSAPIHWEANYGAPDIHGYFTGGFLVGGPERCVKEAYWEALRREIDEFNDGETPRGRELRILVGALFQQAGLEIVRIELGQDPYRVDHGFACPLKHRYEHFGFRDGLSQPFVDIGLGDPPAGSGTPGVEGTWSPVAHGEIFLDEPDEDGACALTPVNDQLRKHATYVVFRKLEQDVVGFRSFVGEQRPHDKLAQAKLSAQIVGRWPRGAPLVLSPDRERCVADDDPALNNFRYLADDPTGAKCPLAAHIRRANPRDTGGRDEVKRHRILRRSIAYGGSLLDEDSLGGGRKRGLFFVAVNSRIDLQFEVIQADWLNGGDFLGQAGLGRCPLTGAHDGKADDSFLAARSEAPLRGLPRFVTTRGGDYFIAPGLETLGLIADAAGQAPNGAKPTPLFPPTSLPYDGYSAAARVLPLIDDKRLAGYGARILASADPSKQLPRTITVQTPARPDGGCDSFVFVGRYDDVVRVLSDKAAAGGGREFSVKAYHETAGRITVGGDFLISTESGSETRAHLHDMLNAAWGELWRSIDVPETLAGITHARTEAALRRTVTTGRIDLVHDLAGASAYGVITELFGLKSPGWLTELAAALPLGAQHLTELPSDWLAVLKGRQPADPGLTSIQTWSVIMLADTMGNFQAAQEAWALSHQAGSEMLAWIGQELSRAVRDAQPPNEPTGPKTLVEAFIAVAPQFVGKPQSPRLDVYLRQAAIILMELAGDAIAAVPAAFGNVLEFILDNQAPLGRMAPGLLQMPDGVERLILEADRLNPVLPVLLRYCETDTQFDAKTRFQEGQWVAALVRAANLDAVGKDGPVFTDPMRFSLQRDKTKYLMFGVPDRVCWGQNRIAMQILVPCVLAAARLAGLRRLAGPGGKKKEFFKIGVGLPAGFNSVRPPWEPAQTAHKSQPAH